MTHNPYAVTPRKPLTPKQRMKMFLAHDGICCICGFKIDGVREAWDEHVDPLWLNGTNDEKNRRPAHAKCARQKTAMEAGQRSKDEAVAERHFGARKRATMPGSRNSPWKRKMDGSVVRR